MKDSRQPSQKRQAFPVYEPPHEQEHRLVSGPPQLGSQPQPLVAAHRVEDPLIDPVRNVPWLPPEPKQLRELIPHLRADENASGTGPKYNPPETAMSESEEPSSQSE
jgi:hypothetical protein